MLENLFDVILQMSFYGMIAGAFARFCAYFCAICRARAASVFYCGQSCR